jgi:uncharacterized membrane protein
VEKHIHQLRMRRIRYAQLREFLFRAGVMLKGLDGALEIAGGVALWLIQPRILVRWVGMLTQDEIAEDPHDLVANFLRHAASRLSVSGEHFMALYLLGHGVVKLFVVGALLRDKLWGYPLAITVFGGFILYQIYRFTLNGSLGLVVLSIF